MIVRISNEGQFRLHDGLQARLDELDDAAVAAVQSSDDDAFDAALEELLQVVRTEGTRLRDDDLEASDVILPPADLSLVEAAQEFTGEGLIPGA